MRHLKGEKNRIFYAIMLFITLIPIILLGVYGYSYWQKYQQKFDRHFLNQGKHNLDPTQKKEFYQFLANQVGGVYETLPEPLVGRILKPNKAMNYGGVEVMANNAGMRSRTDFRTKPENVYRIVCLGDSFVFGHGGLEEDRYGNQIEVFLKKKWDKGSGETDRSLFYWTGELDGYQ